MMPPRRKSKRRKSDRRLEAEKAVEHLSRVLVSGLKDNLEISDNAARQLISVGKKHGVRASPGIRRAICRSCRKSLSPGISSRVRISSNKITTTCLRCGRVSREKISSRDVENE